MENAIVIPSLLGLSAAKLKGRARGALVCGFFGAGWMFEGLYWGAVPTPAWLSLTGLLAAAFVLWPLAHLLSLRHMPYSSADREWWPSVATAYWTIVIVECLALSVAANLLARTGHSDLIPQALGLIIGLHFAPLAKIFRAPIYYWTGAVMILGVIGSLAIPAGHLRTLIACGMNGYALWATAAVILCQDRLALRWSPI